jgi:hypothetical protein
MHLAVRDGVVLETRRHAVALRVHVGADVFERQVEADVAIKIAIVTVARVTLLRAPHLLRRFRVAPECGHPAGAVERSIDAVLGTLIREENAVRIDEEVANTGLAQ